MYLFLDTETGGLTPDHSLLTLSAIAVDASFNVVPVLDFSPGVYLQLKHASYVTQPRAMEINGINLADHDVHGFTVDEAREVLSAYVRAAKQYFGIERLQPAGHNVGFDVQFLQAQVLPKEEWRCLVSDKLFDTCELARRYGNRRSIPGGYSLRNLCDVFGIDPGQSHNAECDNLSAIQLAKKLVEVSAFVR